MNRQYRQCNHAKPNATCSFENAKSFLDMYFFVMPDRAPKIMLDDQKQKPFCRNLRHASCQQIYTCIHVYTNNNVNQTFFFGKGTCVQKRSVWNRYATTRFVQWNLWLLNFRKHPSFKRSCKWDVGAFVELKQTLGKHGAGQPRTRI
jgi:hypothetical protein